MEGSGAGAGGGYCHKGQVSMPVGYRLEGGRGQGSNQVHMPDEVQQHAL